VRTVHRKVKNNGAPVWPTGSGGEQDPKVPVPRWSGNSGPNTPEGKARAIAAHTKPGDCSVLDLKEDIEKLRNGLGLF